MTDRLELMGAPGSPYTRKMLALLRYRHIPYNIIWGGPMGAPEGYPKPKVALLPTFYFADGDGNLEAAVDSTPIIRRLEKLYAGRSVIPEDEALRFLDLLIEDYADEWLTKAMFHFRWAFQADADNAGPLLIHWADPSMADDEVGRLAGQFSKRQIDRLYVVGSNEITAKTIEYSFVRLLDLLDRLIQQQGFVLGGRPSSCDFALHGQLTQLTQVEPTAIALTRKLAPRVRAWVDRMDDLSGHKDGEWLAEAQYGSLHGLLSEIGRTYAPFLIANAKAVQSGAETFETKIDGRKWQQPPFPYQAKCLVALRDAYQALSAGSRNRVDGLLAGTGCQTLFAKA
ncbi:MAG: glutathione S-transferase [Sphingomonadales bacterium]|nr:glutathione S-transferase [Sphingomonadales bacterium]PIX65381.1 MAG: glutathione S-transferase [Sphingomonadales bacterium CG_4_10_14_3_um_filter_58_15]NCO49538.1 glutathione S-transferase [Sphingomonadales bacterium]NCP01131.1 glutathione S-transferase [Sphingomonadales bacterium]NCP28070.1 glutathione S-transferase [Sphingomonadales bacterium]